MPDMAVQRFFHERVLLVHTPIITGSDCEGAGQMFRVSTLDLCNLPRREGEVSRCQGAEVPSEGKTTAPVSSPSTPRHLGTSAPLPIDFSQDFFGKEAHLTVSGQLNVETYCCALSRVYTFGPTFRAENSNTSRHLAEFWMIEPEIAFADLVDDARLAEECIRFLIDAVLTERPDDMKLTSGSRSG